MKTPRLATWNKDLEDHIVEKFGEDAAKIFAQVQPWVDSLMSVVFEDAERTIETMIEHGRINGINLKEDAEQ